MSWNYGAGWGDAVPASTLTGTTLASNIVNSSLTNLGTQSETLNMGSNLVSNVLDPVSAQDAATKAFAENLVTSLWDDRGNYDASGNTFPATGGSGTAGAIVKGDIWTVSVAGTLGGTAVGQGDTVRAVVDAPGQTAGNWAIGEGNLGYTPLSNTLNSARMFVGNGSNVATGVDITGDVTVNNTGVTAIGASKVTATMLASKTGSGSTVVLSTSPTIDTGITLSSAPLTMSGNISSAAWTTNGIRIKGVAATFTDTSSSGTVAEACTNALGGNTIAASSTTTYTDYATIRLRNPTAGTNVTMTNKYALWADSIRANFFSMGPPQTIASSVMESTVLTSSYIHVTGATNFSRMETSGLAAGTVVCLRFMSPGGTLDIPEDSAPSGTAYGFKLVGNVNWTNITANSTLTVILDMVAQRWMMLSRMVY